MYSYPLCMKLFIAYLLPKEHLNICGEVQYIINFPVTNIKNENNCFVLKNYPLPTNEFEKNHQNHLNWILTDMLRLNFVPGLTSTIFRLFRSDEKINFYSHHCIQLPKISQSIEFSMPGSQMTGLEQVKKNSVQGI